MYSPRTKSNQRTGLMLGVLLLFSAMSIRAASLDCGSCYQEYAIKLRSAVLAFNLTELRSLIRNESLISDEGLRMFIGSEEEPSFKQFFSEHETTIFVESIHEEKIDRAFIYFVRTSKVPKSKAPQTAFIAKLKGLTDFVACYVEGVGGVITMPESLCFMETDTFELETYGQN